MLLQSVQSSSSPIILGVWVHILGCVIDDDDG